MSSQLPLDGFQSESLVPNKPLPPLLVAQFTEQASAIVGACSSTSPMQPTQAFQAYLSTEPCSSSLNVLPELWAAATATAAAGGVAAAAGGGEGAAAHEQLQQQQWRREGRGFAAAEVERWGCSAVLLHGRVLRQLRLEGDGSIAAKLS